MESKKFSLPDRIKSFGPAFNGLKDLIKEHHNARIHLAVAFLVVIAGYFMKISSRDWSMIILAAALVFSMELLNSSIESLADKVSKEKSETMRKIKDLSAAAVLVSAIGAALIGIIIFLPRIQSLF